jgi:hypothetical protein
VALLAYKVIVQVRHVAGHRVALAIDAHPLDIADALQHVERAVHGCQAHTGVQPRGARKDLVRGERTPRAGDHLDHRQPRLGDPVARLAQGNDQCVDGISHAGIISARSDWHDWRPAGAGLAMGVSPRRSHSSGSTQ